MLTVVFCRRQQFKISKSVVQSVAVLMMDVFFPIETTSKMLFHFHTMFEAPSSFTRSNFNQPVYKRRSRMVKSSRTNCKQISRTRRQGASTTTPVFVSVPWNEFSVTQNVTFASSRCSVNNGSKFTAPASANILLSKPPRHQAIMPTI
jgi:hypothetical protein